MYRKAKLLLWIPLFFLFAISTKAQILPEITPDNIDIVVDEIFLIHGGQIDHDYDFVHDFISGLVPDSSNDPGYDSNCTPPTTTLDNIDASSLSYSWAPESGAYGYQASYLKLSSPIDTSLEMGTVVTTATSAQFNVNGGGLVLVAFQTKCSRTGVGKVSVIIVDKPVFFEHANEDCSCSFPGITQSEEFSGIALQNLNESDIIDFDYTQDGSIGYYSSSIEYDNGMVSTFLIKVEFAEGAIIISKVCEENTYSAPGGNILYSIREDGAGNMEILGAVSFSDGISFNPVPGATGEMFVTECLEEDEENVGNGSSGNGRSEDDADWANGNLQLNASPNPAKEMITIDLPTDLDLNNCVYYLLDMRGNKLPLAKNQMGYTNEKVNMETSQLPVGAYYFVLQTNNRIMKTHFIKVN